MNQPADFSALESLSYQIQHRRSIKPVDMDTTRSVEKELLLKMLENANYAPSHGLTEPWRFTVFQGESRQELATALQQIYQQITPAGEFREDKMKKLGDNPLLAPVVITIGMVQRSNGKIPELEEVEAVACAVQNMHLTASAAGLAAFWSSPPLLGSPQFAQWLGLQDGDRCLGLFYVGWPKAGFTWPKAVRRPYEEKVTWR